jgi:signal transduction histidine kinase
LPKRSLGGRLVGALLIAYALISVLVIGVNYWELRRDVGNTALYLGVLVLGSVDDVDDGGVAQAVVRGYLNGLNRLRAETDQIRGDPIRVQLKRRDGAVVFDDTAAALADRAVPAGVVTQMDIKGRRHAVHRAEGQRWSLLVLDPVPSDADLVRWLVGQLGIYLLMALPVLLFTLWLAVRSGLKPLLRFSRRLQAFDARHGWQPLEADLRYAELQPVARAFDALLARLREHLAIERAFVQDAAHELRTPLAALGAQAHVLLNSPDDAARQAAAGTFQQGLQRTAHLGQQLLDLSAVEPGRRGDAEDIDLAALAAVVVHQAHAEARRRHVELALEAPDALPWRGERQPLQSILQNLVDNAVRYGASRVELQLGAGPSGPCLAVLDNGRGIPPRLRERVFERFWRGAEHDEPGTGLGLAIAARAAARLEARLRLGDGLDGRGVGFHLELPGGV